MTDGAPMELPAALESGRQTLEHAASMYGRPLSGQEYWWLGVGLAACTLAELADRPYAVKRIEQLVDRLGYKGAGGDWLQRFVEELAELNAEGLLWPCYQRVEGGGPVTATGVTVREDFDARSAWVLALAHIGIAVSIHREDQAGVSALAESVARLVEDGLSPADEATVLQPLRDLP